MTGSPDGGRVHVVASEATSHRWAARLEEMGVPARAIPWSVIAPGPDCERANDLLRVKGGDRSNPRRLVLFTSKNAVAFLPAHAGAGWQAVAVGPETARAAVDAGFTVDVEADADPAGGFASVARQLVARLGSDRRAIWLRGESAQREGVRILEAAGWIVAEFVTYVAEPRLGFEASVLRAPPARAWVVGSPAAATALLGAFGARGFPPPGHPTRVFVKGESTAAALRSPGRAPVEIVTDLPDGVAARLGPPHAGPAR
jgi:uroporphyrinogen-III synthase